MSEKNDPNVLTMEVLVELKKAGALFVRVYPTTKGGRNPVLILWAEHAPSMHFDEKGLTPGEYKLWDTPPEPAREIIAEGPVEASRTGYYLINQYGNRVGLGQCSKLKKYVGNKVRVTVANVESPKINAD